MNASTTVSALLLLLLLAAVLHRRRARQRLRAARLPQRRKGAFQAAAWARGWAAMPPRNYHRPADVQLTDPHILPPPREVRGHIGE